MDKYKNALQAVKPNKAVQEKPENKNQRGGKRSNPEFSPSTFFLRKATRRKANQLLLDTGDMDLSDLMEILLQEWIAKQKKSQ